MADFQALRISLSPEDFDHALAQAECEGLSHLEFLRRLVSPMADRRRERSIAYRIRQAGFPETKTLEGFDWTFNAEAIDRTRIEELATGEFVRRGANLVMVGQSGVGKSHLLLALGRRLCASGYRVRYTTSAELLQKLTASLADGTLPSQLRWWSRFDLVIIDEFGFDHIERRESPQAANLLYKVIDARTGRRSTALGTNVEFDAWSDYLGDPPLAMAVLDRVVYRAIMMPIAGRSYRAAQAQRPGDVESSNQRSTPPADDWE